MNEFIFAVEMEKTCKNCNHPVEGNYCSNCGQTAKTGRIDTHYLVHEFAHGVLHVDKGIFYTMKELFVRPGVTIRDYLDGKRIKHFKPFSYLFLLATIYGFLMLFLNISLSYDEILFEGMDDEFRHHQQYYSDLLSTWMIKHYAMFNLALLPFIALGSFWIFRKSGYNYGENLILNAYVSGQQIIILLAILPAIYFIDNKNLTINIQMIMNYAIFIYMYMSIFNMLSWKARILRIIGCIFLTLIFSGIIGMLIGFVMMIINQ